MKRFYSFLLIAALLLGMTACGKAARTPAPQPADETAADPVAAYWDGQWYGWWVIWEGTGVYAGYAGQWWDVAAEIDCDGTSATMLLWEQNFPKTNPLGEISLNIDADRSESEYGCAVSTGGRFYTGPVEDGSFVIDPAEADYPDRLRFDGEITDENGDTFSYSVCIRPWGMLWDDVKAECPEELPRNYHNWYIALINAGKPIPDVLPEDSLID